MCTDQTHRSKRFISVENQGQHYGTQLSTGALQDVGRGSQIGFMYSQQTIHCFYVRISWVCHLCDIPALSAAKHLKGLKGENLNLNGFIYHRGFHTWVSLDCNSALAWATIFLQTSQSSPLSGVGGRMCSHTVLIQCRLALHWRDVLQQQTHH